MATFQTDNSFNYSAEEIPAVKGDDCVCRGFGVTTARMAWLWERLVIHQGSGSHLADLQFQKFVVLYCHYCKRNTRWQDRWYDEVSGPA